VSFSIFKFHVTDGLLGISGRQFQAASPIDLPLTRKLPIRSLPSQPKLQWEHLTRSKNKSELRIAAYLPKARSSHTPPQEFCRPVHKSIRRM